MCIRDRCYATEAFRGRTTVVWWLCACVRDWKDSAIYPEEHALIVPQGGLHPSRALPGIPRAEFNVKKWLKARWTQHHHQHGIADNCREWFFSNSYKRQPAHIVPRRFLRSEETNLDIEDVRQHLA